MGMGFQAAFWGMALAFGNPCAFLFTKKGSLKPQYWFSGCLSIKTAYLPS